MTTYIQIGGGDKKILRISLHRKSRYMVAVLEQGDVLVYSLPHLLPDDNKVTTNHVLDDIALNQSRDR